MAARNLLKSIFAVLALLTVLHLTGLYFYWYWQFWWLDIIVHFLGGVFIAEVALYSYLYGTSKTRQFPSWRHLPVVVGAVLVVGVLWELFEFSVGFTHWGDREFVFDTLMDLVNDSIGAAVGFSYVLSKKPNTPNS